MGPIRVALLLAGLFMALPVPAALAAGNTFYVDGKYGSDSNDGLSPRTAFKTIAHAANSLPKGTAAAGWTVNVQGYTDYEYLERPIPPAWVRTGTAQAPIVFQATGYVAGSDTAYVKPIINGSDPAPASGQRWSSTSYAGVYSTPWATAPLLYGTLSGPMQTALFQDGSKWIWEQASLSAVASRAKSGLGGYWYDARGKRLYVSAVGSPTTGLNNPAKHSVNVVVRKGFYLFGDAVDYITIRGFDLRFLAAATAVRGADYATIVDNVYTGALVNAIQTAGEQLATGPDPSTGNVISRNRGAYATLQLMKIDEGTTNTTICDNDVKVSGLMGIKVQGPRAGSDYKGITTGVTVCRNTIHDNRFNPTGSRFTNTSGLVIANGAQNVKVSENVVYGNLVGIHITQENAGRRAMNGIVLSHNLIYNNTRFGINFYDGASDAAGARGIMSSNYDVLWGNGIGIQVGVWSRNKTISHATVYANKDDGIRVGVNSTMPATAAVTSSLLTSNGGYGLCAVIGNSATLTYSGVSGNALGARKGSVSTASVNTKPAGYASTDPTSGSYLVISATSYQYTAGPSGTPVGARY